MNPDWDNAMKAKARKSKVVENNAAWMGRWQEKWDREVNREIRRRLEALTDEDWADIAERREPALLRALGVPDA